MSDTEKTTKIASLSRAAEGSSGPGEAPIILSFENVHYEEGNEALRGLSFDLRAGDNIVFFGPENCGKDLIMPLASGIVDPDQGRVRFLDHDLSNLAPTKLYNLRQQIGFLLRDYGLINNLTLENNILLPLRYHKKAAQAEDRLEELLEFFQLLDKKDLRPHSLSPSEKLKACFIRSILLKPRLIILDNAVEAHCPLELARFFDLAAAYFFAHETAFMVITYDVETFRDHAEHFCLMSEGLILHRCGPAELENPTHPGLIQYINRRPQGPLTKHLH